MKRLKPLAKKPHRITLDDLSPAKRKKAEAVIARQPEVIARIEANEKELLAEAREFKRQHEAHQARLRAAIDQLKAEREAQGLSLAEVSRRTRISKPSLSRLENGRNLNPTIETLRRYAAAVGKAVVVQVVANGGE